MGLSSVHPTTAYVIRSSGVFLGVVAVVAFTPHAYSLGKVGMKSIILLVLAGILAGFVAQIVFYKALKLGEISRIVPIVSCAPLFTFFWDGFFWEKKLPCRRLWGYYLS